MEIKKSASAGTMESSDAYVEISPNEGGIKLQTESVVFEQFGETINNAVMEVLNEKGVENAFVHIIDRGALECVLKARVETAILRSGEEE